MTMTAKEKESHANWMKMGSVYLATRPLIAQCADCWKGYYTEEEAIDASKNGCHKCEGFNVEWYA